MTNNKRPTRDYVIETSPPSVTWPGMMEYLDGSVPVGEGYATEDEADEHMRAMVLDYNARVGQCPLIRVVERGRQMPPPATVTDLIALSISGTEIAHADYSTALAEALSVECEDSSITSAVAEYWGADEDGNEWRVHLDRDEPSDDDAEDRATQWER